MGAADLGIVEYPGNVPMDTADQLADKVGEQGTESAAKPAEAAEPAPHNVVFAGSLRAVQDYFDDCEWSDGLPIVPPTREHVEEFLAWTDRDPDEVIGVLPPEFREASVWS